MHNQLTTAEKNISFGSLKPGDDTEQSTKELGGLASSGTKPEKGTLISTERPFKKAGPTPETLHLFPIHG